MVSLTKHSTETRTLRIMGILMITILTVTVLKPSRLDIIMLIRCELVLINDFGYALISVL